MSRLNYSGNVILSSCGHALTRIRGVYNINFVKVVRLIRILDYVLGKFRQPAYYKVGLFLFETPLLYKFFRVTINLLPE